MNESELNTLLSTKQGELRTVEAALATAIDAILDAKPGDRQRLIDARRAALDNAELLTAEVEVLLFRRAALATMKLRGLAPVGEVVTFEPLPTR